jgi:nucleoside-diphosphate-sugar epimerase
MIYGSELDHNMHKLLRFLDRSPVFPMFGAGNNLWQPVYFKDLAQGVLAALEKPEAIEQTYDLPGAEPLTYLDLVRAAAAALGSMALAGAERLGLSLPIKSEQVLRLWEDKAYPYEKARRELGYEPCPFPEGIALEVRRLREIGVVRP